MVLLLAGCSRPLASNLSEYTKLDSSTKYFVSQQTDSGFELSVYFKSRDFYTEERHLAAEGELTFKRLAKILCEQSGRELGSIDDNTFLVNADAGQKAVHVVNWVAYTD